MTITIPRNEALIRRLASPDPIEAEAARGQFVALITPEIDRLVDELLASRRGSREG